MKPQTLLLLALPSLALRPASAQIVERVVAKVNGDIVTLSEFQSRQIASAQQARVSADKVEAYLRQNNAKILQEATDELLLSQRAAELGMKMRPEMIRDVIEGIKKENNLESDGELQEQLRREGMSLDDLKRSIEHTSLRREVLRREVDGKVVVSEDESYAVYQADKATLYTKPATVTLEEILVNGDDAQDKAKTLVARARAGEDFQTLARAYSAAPSARHGGELGTLAKGEMNPELEKEAFAVPAGTISDPIAQGEGYRVIHVLEKTEGSVTPYDQVKTDIKKKLTEEKGQKEYTEYLDGLRKKAVIEIKVREVPLALSGPIPDNALLDTPLLGGKGPQVPAKPAAGPAPVEASGGDEAEISTSTQAAPERVAPPPGPDAKPEEKKPEKPPAR
jgi:parvulin-like peptidyl-prolyl isomerase